MKIFHCDHCGHLLFFENTTCISCARTVAYLPDVGLMGSLDAVGDGRWTSPLAAEGAEPYRLCRNYTETEVCNWAVAGGEVDGYCVCCRLTEIIPELSSPDAHEAWYRLEVAKRRLVFTLLSLSLPIVNRADDPAGGLSFQFKADPPPGTPGAPVLTGHDEGVITINIAEADDVERERRRKAVHEPYRTLLGHMRHESAHYYWNRLVRGTSELEPCRAVFGDERRDYAEALAAHYDQGPPTDWPQRFVSAYASAHPWEDWAETWAHYLHMYDTVETGAACGVSLRPRRSDEPSLPRVPDPGAARQVSFGRLIDSWFPLTYLLNNLNRGLGLADPYPFVLSAPAVDKLRYVHDLVARRVGAAGGRRGAL